MECPQHRIVSLTGNIGPDGSAAYYNVIFSMADAVKARHFPMPLPVFVSSAEERRLLHQQAMIRSTLLLAAEADVTFVGIGELGPSAPLRLDGFLDEGEIAELEAAGAVGEICGWVFDADGRLLDGITRKCVASAPIPSRDTSVVIADRHGIEEDQGDFRRASRPARQRPDHRRGDGAGAAATSDVPATQPFQPFPAPLPVRPAAAPQQRIPA